MPITQENALSILTLLEDWPQVQTRHQDNYPNQENSVCKVSVSTGNNLVSTSSDPSLFSACKCLIVPKTLVINTTILYDSPLCTGQQCLH